MRYDRLLSRWGPLLCLVFLLAAPAGADEAGADEAGASSPVEASSTVVFASAEAPTVVSLAAEVKALLEARPTPLEVEPQRARIKKVVAKRRRGPRR